VSSPAARRAAAPSTLGHPTAAGTGDDTYLMRLKALRDQRDAVVERTAPGLPGHRAVEWLRALGESFQVADVPKEREELMHAIYERITVAGPRDRRCPADPGGLRARIGAGAARKG